MGHSEYDGKEENVLFHEQANTFIMEKLCVFILNDDIS
jgi:hypothetical protein